MSRFDTVIERSFAAPIELVFRAWTEAEHLAQWWGPHGFTNPVCRFAARPGGEIYIEMQAPDGTVFPMHGRVSEIAPPSRLVFVSAAQDPAGRPLFEVESTVDFRATPGGTAIKLQARVLSVAEGVDATPYLSGMELGWSQSLEKLAAHLAAVAEKED